MNLSESTSKPIFANLDGIRFLAFLGVFISHCFFPRSEQVKTSSLFHFISFFVRDSRWGNLGLYIFFSMSGFLITYLLIHEYKAFGKIQVFAFYMRRVLRIWPLYFALIGFNFFIYPILVNNPALSENKLPFFLFYANFDVIRNGFNPGVISHLWAVSIEEQFYLLLPLTMLLVPLRYLHFLFATVIVVSQGFRIIHYDEPNVLFHHSLSASFDIALGGLSAWLVYFNEKWRSAVAALSRSLIITIYVLCLVLLLCQEYLFNSQQLIISLFIFQLFAIFILTEQNFATHSFVKVGELKWITHLGKYAYGFFCYHILCTRVVEVVAYKLEWRGIVSELIIIPLLGLLLTLGVGVASYHLFEIRFLNLKKNFTYLK